jgi:hypothetical protein
MLLAIQGIIPIRDRDNLENHHWVALVAAMPHLLIIPVDISVAAHSFSASGTNLRC